MVQSTLHEIKAYWDVWHREWLKMCILTESQIDQKKKIEGWKIPLGNLGNKENSCKYFPEPYWGNINALANMQSNLHGVFLNINPGQGGDEQLFKENFKSKDEVNEVISELLNKKLEYINNERFFYSQIVSALSENTNYNTTKWMIEKRISWVKKIQEDNKIDLGNYLFFDLVPWHTPSKSDILDYTLENAEIIMERVLKQVSKLASEIQIGPLKNKVIVRGSLIIDVINNADMLQKEIENIKNYVVIDNTKHLNKISSLITTFNLRNHVAKFFVFSGGASMLLPNPEYMVFGIDPTNPENQSSANYCSLKDWIKM